MRYAVVRAIHSPTAGDVRAARLVLEDVPDKTSVADVAQALEAAGRSADFSEGGVPFGNHEIRAEGRSGWPKGIAGLDGAPALTWARLVTPPTPSEGRRVTLRLSPAKHAAYSLAAERQGVSLQQWCESALDAARERDAMREQAIAAHTDKRRTAAEPAAAAQ
jgi:HicB family